MLNKALTDPFAMLLHLDDVVREVSRSERLARLARRVYHPLDKPLLDRVGARREPERADLDGELDEGLVEDSGFAAI